MCVAATFSDHAGQVAGAISATGLSRDIQARGLRRAWPTTCARPPAGSPRCSAAAHGAGGHRREGADRPATRPRGSSSERPDPQRRAGELLIAPVVGRACAAPTSTSSTARSIPPSCATRSCSGTSGRAGCVDGDADDRSRDAGGGRGAGALRALRRVRAGATNRCQNYDEFGFNRDGAAADLLVAPAPRRASAGGRACRWESGRAGRAGGRRLPRARTCAPRAGRAGARGRRRHGRRCSPPGSRGCGSRRR